MIKKHSQSWIWRGSGAIVAATLALPLVGCGSNAPAPTNSAPPASNTQSRPSMGLSTKQKVVLLAGAAALYYYYNRSKKATAAQYGQQIQYYRSKNGRIYYRDPKNPQKVNWVTPPPNNYTQSVPANEAQQYSDYQGFNNANTGKTLEDAFPVR